MTLEDFVINFDRNTFTNRIFVAFRHSVVEVGNVKVERPLDARFSSSVSFWCTLGERIDLRKAIYITFHVGDEIYICTFNPRTKLTYITHEDDEKTKKADV